MSCVEDTNSIDLSVAGGMLEATLNLDPSAQNLLSVSSAGTLASLNGGWLPMGATLAYSSADSPTFVATTSIDLTGLIPVGAKVWLTQSASSLYFIVTAITNTTITLYGGVNYTLANATITAPYFSYMRTPVGFSTDPANWTAILNDTTNRTQGSAVENTWYNLGALALTIPIGAWNVSYQVSAYAAAGFLSTTLSTANNSESDPDFTAGLSVYGTNVPVVVFRQKSLTLASKTTYYLNAVWQSASTTTLGFNYTPACPSPTIIRAICAYL